MALRKFNSNLPREIQEEFELIKETLDIQGLMDKREELTYLLMKIEKLIENKK